MKKKTISVILIILYLVYLFLSPIIYKAYIDNGYAQGAAELVLGLIGIIGLFVVFIVFVETTK